MTTMRLRRLQGVSQGNAGTKRSPSNRDDYCSGDHAVGGNGMKIRSFGFALNISLVAALLTGCVSMQAPIGAPGALRPNAGIKSSGTRNTDLLYVVDGRKAVFLTFPQGEQVGELSGIGHPLNVCSDTAGNVWSTSSLDRNDYRLYEFAHGGTEPIATLDVPKMKSAVACAVNPINRDLAVLNNYGGTGNDSVLIWPGGARSVTPIEYPVDFVPTACAYDKHGDLLATGWEDSDGYYFAEKKYYATQFKNITVKPHTFLAGSVRWDGRHFAVAMQQRRGSSIYRLRIAASTGKVVQVVHLKPFANPRLFAIKGGMMVGTELSHAERLLGIWKYPLGGTPVSSFHSLKYPLGLAISAKSGS